MEVGGALGPSFEAQAIDISEEGMHLRTAYLPEVGQPLSCRFDAGPGANIIAAGEVVWKQDAAKGGEFGIRFTDLDPQSAEALQRVIGIACAPPAPAKGNRVRLHIEGLGSPMRAHVKESGRGQLTAFSGLGFLQVGKHLELEDAATGAKRPAKVVRVECEVDPASRVPQLVMSFQYEDEQATNEAAKEDTPEPMVTHEEPSPADATASAAKPAARAAAKSAVEDESLERASEEMKGVVARTASKVTPALERLFDRAKTTVAVLAAKRRGGTGDDVAIPLRRRTSPAPQGGLHASGRKVVRESAASAKEIPAEPASRTWNGKRTGLVVGTVGVLLLGALALHKPGTAAAPGATDPNGQAGAQVSPTPGDTPVGPPPSVLTPSRRRAPRRPRRRPPRPARRKWRRTTYSMTRPSPHRHVRTTARAWRRSATGP